MSGTIQKPAKTALTERYEALLRVSQKLISIRSMEELFRHLALELRSVVNFYVMGGGLAVATFITLLLVPVFYAIFVLDLKWITWETTANER